MLMALLDRMLAGRVRDELHWDPLLDHRRIVVKAFSGRISLTGLVESPGDMILATDDAWMVRGVTEVHNELLVEQIDDVRANHYFAFTWVTRPILAFGEWCVARGQRRPRAIRYQRPSRFAGPSGPVRRRTVEIDRLGLSDE